MTSTSAEGKIAQNIHLRSLKLIGIFFFTSTNHKKFALRPLKRKKNSSAKQKKNRSPKSNGRGLTLFNCWTCAFHEFWNFPTRKIPWNKLFSGLFTQENQIKPNILCRFSFDGSLRLGAQWIKDLTEKKNRDNDRHRKRDWLFLNISFIDKKSASTKALSLAPYDVSTSVGQAGTLDNSFSVE